MDRLRTVLAPTDAGGISRRYAALAGVQEFAIWLPLPVLVLHMSERGIDLALIGLAFAVRAVCVVALEIPTGGLADAIGRKPIAIASQLFTFVSLAFLLVVGGPVTLFAYAVFQGIGSALHSGALEAWYVDRLRSADPAVALQPHLAGIAVAQTAAMLAGAAIGGSLPALFSGLALPWPLAGFGIALVAGLSLRAVALWLTLVLVDEPEFVGTRRTAALGTLSIVRDGMRLARTVPVMRYLLVAGAAMGLAIVALETLWQPIAGLTFGSDPEGSAVFGVLGFVLGAAGLLGSLAVMRFGHLVPGGPAVLAGLSQVVKVVGMLVLALHAGALGVSLGVGLAFFAIATQNVPHDTLVNDAVPAERRSIMLSINSLVFFVGVALGSALLGPLASATGPRLALVVAAACTLVASAAYVGVARRLRGAPRARTEAATEASRR